MVRRIVLVEYFFTASKLFAFGIRSDFLQPAVMEIDTDIHQLTQDLREIAPHLNTRVAELVQWPAIAQCIAPIVQWSSPDDLICVVPSGPLFYVPLHAVPVNGVPLMLRNPLFYAPSASALRYCVRRRKPSGPPRSPAVFGNPEGDLISTRREATAVAAILGVQAHYWKEVTRARFQDAMASSDLIHFAGHAHFDHTDPLASGLRLAGDEVITARDLFELGGASLRLVTLSACETGYNEVHPGDELIGLTRALLYAGASSLLVTLWKIEDTSSATLMSAFYQHWLCEGLAKVDALREAQIELRGQAGDPSRWAPYFLIGDWV